MKKKEYKNFTVYTKGFDEGFDYLDLPAEETAMASGS